MSEDWNWDENPKEPDWNKETPPQDGGGNNSGNSGGDKGYQKKSYGGGGGGGYKKKPPPTPRLPLWVVVHGNDDINDESIEKLLSMAFYLASKGFEVRYSKEVVNLATAIEAKIAKDQRRSFVPWNGYKSMGSEVELHGDFIVNDRVKNVMDLDNTFYQGLAKVMRSKVGVQGAMIYGPFAESPAQLLLIATPDGITNIKQRSKATGYASTSIEQANKISMDVINVNSSSASNDFKTFLARYAGDS